MNIDLLAQQEWEIECQGNPEILDDYNKKHYFFIGFKNGFEQGNSRPPMEINSVKMFKAGMINNTSMQDTMCMQLRISTDQYSQKLQEFLTTQSLINKVYKTEAEINLHYLNWLRKQVSSGAMIKKGNGKL